MRQAILVVVVVCAAVPRAFAYDFAVDVRTIGQGYQVRGFAPDGSNELLSRRRLTQYLDLAVVDIGPSAWHGDDGVRNLFTFEASFRLDADFGGYPLGAPGGAAAIPELKQSQLDILYAYFGGRNVGGRLDFQLGRQIHFDLIDFYALDGADLVLHVSRLLAVEALAGTEVRGELPVSSPIYELDGTSAGSRDPATRPDQNSDAGAHGGRGGRGGAAQRRVHGATGVPRGLVRHRRSPAGRAGQRRELRGPVADRGGALARLGQRQRRAALQRPVRRAGRRAARAAGEADPAPVDHAGARLPGAHVRRRLDWNVFATGAYRDLRASYELGLPRGVKAYARGFVRYYAATADDVATLGPYAGQDVGADAPGGRRAEGASLGAAWRSLRGMARADLYWDDGYGGRKLGGDATVRLRVNRPLELEGRATGYAWRDDLQGAGAGTASGLVFGVQAGGRYQLGPGARLHALLEDNFGTYYASQFRGLAMVELDAGL